MRDFDLPRRADWGHRSFARYVEARLFYPCVSVDFVAARARGRLAYLATPYSKLVVGARGAFDLDASAMCGLRSAQWSTRLARAGVTVVSPIAQASLMVAAGGADPRLDPLDADFWTGWCAPMLRACGSVVVPPLDGWQESEGVWHEVREALQCQKRVFLIGGGLGA